MRKAEVFKMPSGAALHVGMAEFEKAGALMRAVLKQVAGLKISATDLQTDLSELRERPETIMKFIDKAISLATSDEVRLAALACAESSKYSPKANDGLISVDADLFNDEEYGVQAREDYYTILYRIAEVNCKPFFAKTFSGFLAPKKPSMSVPA